jgi:hypothetical protein
MPYRGRYSLQKKIFLTEEDIPYRRRYSSQKIFLTEEDIPYRRRYSLQKKIFLIHCHYISLYFFYNIVGNLSRLFESCS